jgi:NADPH-dependent 2,4-dienoyl-CoA reductase/sulfur reductase-like enzyme/nitrite reductase/ring-hydroxylating ferredoxin subunit
MENNEWKKTIQDEDLKEGLPQQVIVEEKKVMLVRINGDIHACGNECSHYHAPLTDGVLKDGVVTCPDHNAKFDVTTGQMVSAPALNNLPVYETMIKDGDIYVRKAGSNIIPMPEGKDDRTFLIIGAGASGNAAAEMLRRKGFSGRIVMVTSEKDLPYDRTMLSKDYLSGEAPAKWLPLRGEKFYDRLHIEILTDYAVQSLDPGKKSVSFRNGKILTADKILLATGGTPRKLNLKGSDLEGCHYLRTLNDCNNIISCLENAEQAVVLGASFIGLEVAAALTHRGLTVHVAAPEQVPLAAVFGEKIGRWIQNIHQEKNVNFHMGRTALEIKGNGSVNEVVLDDSRSIKADLVIIGIGVVPAVDFLSDSGLVENGAVSVNGQFQTKAEGIYASGDIAVYPDPRTGLPRRIEHWAEAERQGQHAAKCMLGESEKYNEMPFFWTNQFGTSLKYIGYARQFEQVAFRGSVEEKSFVAGYYINSTLSAVTGVGKPRDIILLGDQMKEGRNIDPHQFEDPGFDLSQ